MITMTDLVPMTDLMTVVTPVRMRPQYDAIHGYAAVADVVLANAPAGVHGTGVSTGNGAGIGGATFETPRTHTPVTRKQLVGVLAVARFPFRSTGSNFGPPV